MVWWYQLCYHTIMLGELPNTTVFVPTYICTHICSNRLVSLNINHLSIPTHAWLQLLILFRLR